MATMRSGQRSRTAILVVDDSPAMLRYLRLLLELDSYQVETANSGKEALRRLKEGYAPAILLLDVEMPGMDGFKTLRELRRLYPQVKVIMCSGIDSPRTIVRAAKLGAQAYINKPVQQLYLSAALERCLHPMIGDREVLGFPKTNVVKMPSPTPCPEAS
jgi:CheY-like chemotaxis protein